MSEKPTHEELDAASIPSLLEWLKHDDAAVRGDAACALGDRLRSRELNNLDSSAQEALAQALNDSVPGVQFEAAIALAELHDRRATDTLLAAIHYRGLRLDAVRALGTLGDPAAAPPLRQLMARWLLPWADRLQAAAALCALGDENGAQYLEMRLKTRRKAERAAAIHFMGESRHPQARAALEAILADPGDPMRDVAARALGLLADPAAASALAAARQGADADLRADIDSALTRLNPG